MKTRVGFDGQQINVGFFNLPVTACTGSDWAGSVAPSSLTDSTMTSYKAPDVTPSQTAL